MSEEKLTVEKIKLWRDHYKSGTIDAAQKIGLTYNIGDDFHEYDMVNLLLSQLATIERDTAEKCAKISENIVGNGCDFIEDVIAEGIRSHFNHKGG